MRSLRWGLALVLFTCGGPSDEVASQSGRLVGGTADTSGPQHDTVVVVRANLTRCTGTLIAPLVVLTARHCLVNASLQNTQVVVGGKREVWSGRRCGGLLRTDRNLHRSADGLCG